mmetsp:Transcript_60216/g.129273  ORF Transcript_60216/g.129273 Transcript_60216/m.129273 type:complete len:304 (-) Transcript_60216:3-914(-)
MTLPNSQLWCRTVPSLSMPKIMARFISPKFPQAAMNIMFFFVSGITHASMVYGALATGNSRVRPAANRGHLIPSRCIHCVQSTTHWVEGMDFAGTETSTRMSRTFASASTELIGFEESNATCMEVRLWSLGRSFPSSAKEVMPVQPPKSRFNEMRLWSVARFFTKSTMEVMPVQPLKSRCREARLGCLARPFPSISRSVMPVQPRRLTVTEARSRFSSLCILARAFPSSSIEVMPEVSLKLRVVEVVLSARPLHNLSMEAELLHPLTESVTQGVLVSCSLACSCSIVGRKVGGKLAGSTTETS